MTAIAFIGLAVATVVGLVVGIRLVLREAGLGAKTVSARQAATLVEKLLPGMLEARGIDETDSVCTAMKRALAAVPSGDERDDLASVFRRIR